MTPLADYAKLVSAVEADDKEAVRQLLDKGTDVNANMDNDIGTALHVAARHNSIRCIDLILSPDGSNIVVADVEALATDRQQTALMMAAEHGHVAIVRKLLAAGSDVNRQTDECSSALIVASHYGHVDCVNVLLDSGADPRLMNRWMFNALYMSTDTPEILDRLLTTGCRDDVNTACGERREVPLHLAAVIGSVRAIRSLLAAGADINARTVYDENALWLAAWQGRTEAARILIQNNVELDVPSNGCQVYVRHYLPLEVAAGLEHYDIVRMLLVAGCQLANAKDSSLRVNGSDADATSGSTPVAEAPWIRLHREAFDYMRSHPDFYDWFVQFVRNPVSLRDACRQTIRRRLGTPLAPKIERLGHLPRVIKECIFIKEL